MGMQDPGEVSRTAEDHRGEQEFLHGLWRRTVNREPMSTENGCGGDGSIEQFFCCQLLQLSEVVNHEPGTI